MSFNFVVSSQPGELINHCNFNQYPYTVYHEDNFPEDSWYLIGISFFDFTLDQFTNISNTILEALKKKRIRILFYYHEGDNPHDIKHRLDKLCNLHQLPTDCYRFVSGNTQADQIENFAYFPDHELLFQRQNNAVAPVAIHNQPREKEFTALSRTHKSWRAFVMSDLHRQGIINNSYWSYRTDVTIDQDDNPLQGRFFPGLAEYTEKFLQGAPYVCDTLSVEQQNNHKLVNQEHYSNSYCNIVLETFIDIANCGGTFLTEKTFKPIKNGQPFVVVGPPNTLALLKELGYRTFDHAIDNSYDSEMNIAMRWFKLINAIKKIQAQDLNIWYDSCQEDLEHNQRLFLSSKYNRLNMLRKKL